MRSKKEETKIQRQDKKNCLTLNFLSPTAYCTLGLHLTRAFHTRKIALSKWCSNICGEPGFSDESFVALKEKVTSSKCTIICSLFADEMSIRQQSLWDGKKKRGYVDLGTGTSDDSTTLASEVYVFLLNGINNNFKLPLGYFLVHGLNAEQKANLIKLCLIKCHDAGLSG